MNYNMEELSIEITYKCPMNCLHCSSRAELGNETMISDADIYDMIEIAKEFCGTTAVSLSGGEPFEHPAFWQILRFIKASALDSIVYTCGIEIINGLYRPFSDERISMLKEYCDVLIISLHGSPETHNKMMNIGNLAFPSAIRTIRKAIKANIRVEIHFVPTKINYKDIKFVYGLCLGLDVTKMSILRYVPQGRGLETSEKEGEINLNKEEFFKLQQDMLDLKNIAKHTTPLFRIGIPADFTFLLEKFKGNENAMKERSCTGGKTKILVKADGKVQVCPAWKELDHLSAGDIYLQRIDRIWKNGKTYCDFRNFSWEDLEEPCKSCEFVKSCLGGCGAQRILNTTMRIDGLKRAPDPLCFYRELKNAKNISEWESWLNSENKTIRNR